MMKRNRILKRLVGTLLICAGAAAPAWSTVTVTFGTGVGATADAITFDDTNYHGYTLSTINTSTGAVVTSGTPNGTGAKIETGSVSGEASAPTNDTTSYLAIFGGYGEKFTGATDSSAVTFYWGSPDSYNSVNFYDASGTLLETYTGSQLASAPGYNASSSLVTLALNKSFRSVVLASSSNSFEMDNLQLRPVGAVPEAGSWANYILGFGVLGGVMRRRMRESALANA